jgi:Sulfotransferase domain
MAHDSPSSRPHDAQSSASTPMRVARAATGRAPDFFMVGHPKCGTTALYEMLRRHPQIYMPEFKEPEFFASEMHVGPRPEHLPDTLEDYLALFDDARADQLIGEASTSYLRSRTAAARIAEVQPNARIVAILREPASFLRSVHLQYVQAVIETEYDLGEALALEEDRRQGKNLPRHGLWPLSLQYSEHVRYVEQLRRYHSVFGKDNVLVLIYDDFRADNEETVRSLLRFLDVDESWPVEKIEANPTVEPRSQAVHELMHTVTVGRGPVSRGVKAVIKALTPDRSRRRLLELIRRGVVYGEPPAPDEQLTDELRRRFKPEVLALSEYLDRDLARLWGYDRIP